MGKKILVLGSTGMLGWMVLDYLSRNKEFAVVGSSRKQIRGKLIFDANSFLISQKKYVFLKNFDYIINCIGIIKPFCKDNDSVGVRNAIAINGLFPHVLNEYLRDTKTKIIQIATDCVYSGKDGKYNEDALHDSLDVYGKSKSLGEVFSGNFLNVRCSIIGPERGTKNSLLEWFLSQPKNAELNGFSHHKWNGVTTLQFAKLCEWIIKNNVFKDLVALNPTMHFVPNKNVTKFQLLNIFNEIFNKKLRIIEESKIGKPLDRTLSTMYPQVFENFGKYQMVEAISELKNYLKKYNLDY